MPDAVDQYVALDVSEASAARSQLMARAAEEAASKSVIDLTRARQRHDAQTPAAVTPAMAAWYAAHVAGPRGRAIAELNSAFQNERVPEGEARSTFMEVQRDEVRSKGLSELIQQTAQFLDHNGSFLRSHDRTRQEYNTLKATHNREPVKPRPVIYALVLFGLIALEAFINFESFLKVPYITSPFLATGATLAVAIGIATAAHFHGVVLKQWNYLFSPHNPGDKAHKSRRQDAIRRLVAGAVLLSVALAMVAGSRYYYLREYITQARILGTSPPSMFGGITFMLLGNMVAYVVATLAAYAFHDADPEYAEKDREFRKATKRLEAIRTRRKSDQETERNGLETGLKRALNHAAAARGPNYTSLREAAERVIAKDQEVLGALLDYRQSLIQALSDTSADEARFLFPEGAYEELVPTSIDRTLTPRQYAAEKISLGFSLADASA